MAYKPAHRTLSPTLPLNTNANFNRALLFELKVSSSEHYLVQVTYLDGDCAFLVVINHAGSAFDNPSS